jgi:tRNA A-37 threonylcarbamoyl transferase component Bud32
MWPKSQLTIPPEWIDLLHRHQLDTVDGVYRPNLGTVVASSGTTEVVKVDLTDAPDTRTLFIKKYWYRTLHERARIMWRGTFFGRAKVRREYDNLVRLRAWGLDAPQPVAFGEHRTFGWLKRSFLITESVPHPTPLQEFLCHVLPARPNPARADRRRELIRNLAGCIRRLHEHNFVHHDLFWRNIILSGDSLNHFFLIDAHKGGCWRPGEECQSRAADLACLDAAAPWFFRRAERLRFYLAYAGKSSLSNEDKSLIRLVQSLTRPMLPKQLWRAIGDLQQDHSAPGLIRPATTGSLRPR